MTLVRRRHVIYVQGYDPRGLAEYHRLFRGEYNKFCKLYGLDGKIGKRTDDPDHFSTVWPVATQGRDWRVETSYQFLRWEDIIRRDFQRPAWWAILHGLSSLIGSVFDGTFARIMRAHWRFGMFVAYPFMVLIGFALLSAMAGAIIGTLVVNLVGPSAWPQILGAAVAIAVFVGLLIVTEPTTYIVYILQDAVSTVQYARRQRPDWEARMEIFAQALVNSVRTANADEIIIVGHSSGSFLAIDVLSRALRIDPKLGDYGARLTLLTMGANLPIIGFQPRTDWFRERIAQLAADPTLDWVDCQSRRDIMNFFRFNPVAAFGIDPGQTKINLNVVPVQFRDIVSPQTFAWLCWHFFDLHFQFLRANERPAAYDYFMIIAGPFSLRTRLAMPAEVTAAVAGDEAASRAAWDRLGSKPAQSTNGLAAPGAHGM